MRKQKEKVIAILCADLHLSPTPPIWRSAEPDWYKAMARSVGVLVNLQIEHDCPVLCAGDIFDKWYGAIGKQSAELINWAIEYLPDNMYCIPGQHDLPDHNYGEIERSAYWTLVKAGKIKNLNIDDCSLSAGPMTLYGYPFGSSLYQINLDIPTEKIRVALVHEYRWMKGCSYPGAPKESKINWKIAEMGYDVIVYGDNHKGFYVEANCPKTGRTEIFNCGTLMRRASDEIDYKPWVGLLLESWRVEKHYLDISKDKYIESVEDVPVEEMDMSEFIEELKKLGETGLEFVSRVERFFKKNKTKKVVKQILRKGMEE